MEESRDDRTMRASDADRDRVAEQLRQAAGDGRLSIAELQDRLDALYAAKTHGAREARLESHEVTIDVKAVFGGVSVHRRIVDSTG